jgi:di/tricarboxylate transporter
VTIVFGILVLSIILFATEIVSIDLVALLMIITLPLAGILTPAEALSGFSNPALLTVGALFVVGEGLLRTGAVSVLSQRIIQVSGGRPFRVFLLTVVIVAVVSAFINNTPVVMVFIPVILGVAHRFQIVPSKLLIPISYASILGGTCTLVGTSTNVLVSSLSLQHGYGAFGMFELTPVGLIFLGVGIVYLLVVGRRILPDRKTFTGLLPLEHRRQYVTELEVRPDSTLVGRTIRETISASHPEIRILQLIRGETIEWQPDPDTVLESGDIFIARGDVSDIMNMRRTGDVEILPELLGGSLRFDRRTMTLAELVVSPASSFMGKLVSDIHFRRRFGVALVAIQRHGVHLREKITELTLEAGDILLVFGDDEAFARIAESEDFIMMEGIQDAYVAKDKATVAVLILLSVVFSLTVGALPVVMTALIGAALMILSGCLSSSEAYRSVNWSVLILIGGTIALGLAMEKTGAALFLAQEIVGAVGAFGPVAVLSSIYLVSVLLTAVVSNNAAAVLMVPIAISTAAGLDVDPRPFIMAVAFGASASFATPIGYQTNLLVFAPGGYRYSDFLKVGIPLNVLLWILATFLIPLFWPLV